MPKGISPDPLMSGLVAWIDRWKAAVFLVAAALFVFGVVGMQRVVFDPDVLVYFDRSMPERQALETIEDRFQRTNEIVYVLQARDGGSMLEPERLKAIAWLRDRAQQAPNAIAVRSPIGLVGQQATNGAAELPDPDAIRRAMEEAGFSARSVISEDETVAAVAAVYPRSTTGDIDIGDVTSNARDIQAAFRDRYPDIKLLLTGRLMMDRAFLMESQDETYHYAALQIGVLAIILVITFRSFSAALTLMTLVLITGPATIGAVGWIGFPLNGISSAASTVLLGLGVATGVHIVLAWQRALREGLERKQAVIAAMTVNAAPVTLSIITTIVSFLCLNFAASPPFGQLGNVVSGGLVIVLLLSFTLLPALLLVIPVRSGADGLGLAPAMSRLGSFVIYQSRTLLAAFAICAAVSVAGVAQITFDDTFSHYFDESFEVRRATDLFEEKLSGTTFIDFSVPVSSQGGPFGQEHLADLKAFTEWLRTRPEFAEAVSLYSVTASLAQRAPQLFNEQGLPATPRAEPALRQTYETMRADGMVRLIDDSGQHTRVNVVLRGSSSAEILAFTRDARARAEAIFGQPVIATGLPILSAQLSIDSTRTMLISMVVALFGVSVLMLIALRNLRLGMISLLPNILPAVTAMGIWGFLVGEVSFAATVVGALTFGIVVDDTVHMLMKYQAARRRGLFPKQAVQETVRSVGIAVFVTSLALALSFFVFTFSGFLVNQHLGYLTGLTLIIALIADLLFLPPLLLRSEK